MAAFKSERTFWGIVTDLQPVVSDLVRHFRDQGYQVAAERSQTGLWDVSIEKGGNIRAVAGLKFALKVLIVPEADRIVVTAGVGVFGQRAAPAAVGIVAVRAALFAVGASLAAVVGLPLLVANVWALIKQSKLDDEAMAVVAESLGRIAPEVAGRIDGRDLSAFAPPEMLPAANGMPATFHCQDCGAAAEPDARFCAGCGHELRRTA